MTRKQHQELPLSDDERDDFASACARHGFVPEDFEIRSEQLEPGGSPGPGRKITVTRVAGGDLRTYAAGNGVAWAAAFERDLAQDVFGYPLAD